MSRLNQTPSEEATLEARGYKLLRKLGEGCHAKVYISIKELHSSPHPVDFDNMSFLFLLSFRYTWPSTNRSTRRITITPWPARSSIPRVHQRISSRSSCRVNWISWWSWIIRMLCTCTASSRDAPSTLYSCASPKTAISSTSCWRTARCQKIKPACGSDSLL